MNMNCFPVFVLWPSFLSHGTYLTLDKLQGTPPGPGQIDHFFFLNIYPSAHITCHTSTHAALSHS